MELICPAGTPAAFREAVDAGADAVYCGFRNETNARNFPGLNFTCDELATSIAYGKARGVQTYVALNTFMRAGAEALWYGAADDAVQAGADALIIADLALMAYIAERHPDQRLHVSVQASAFNADAINFLVHSFGAKRLVLPRVLTVADIAALAPQVDCELEVFAFGGLCVMAEGRCSLSSYITGQSPNMDGVCSPASFVRWDEHADNSRSVRLNGMLIDRFGESEPAGYPTVCKGRYAVGGEVFHALEEPTSLNTLELLPQLAQAGVVALKVEGRQRGVAYVRAVASTWRQAIDRYRADPQRWTTEAAWQQALGAHAEGQQTTLGPYHRAWH